MPQVSAPLLGANLGCKLSRALLPLLPHVPYHPRFPLSFAHMPGGGAQHHGRLFHLAALPRHAVHRQVGHHRRQRLWLALIPYIRRINDLGACVHGAHSAKIRSCLGDWYICSAGYFLSFAPGRTLSWKTWPCVSNCWLSMPSDLARDSAQSTNCSGSH